MTASSIEKNTNNGKPVSMHIYLLPNLLTTANLFVGFYAIIAAIQGNFTTAANCIVLAAIFDLLDGRVARMTRATSKFGAEYDSLCDLLSFGIAPALTMYLWSLDAMGRIGWLASFLYVACCALRLARFNVQVNVIEKAYFQGLPSPMAAGIVASAIMAFQELGIEAKGNIWLLLITFLLAFVMVSTFRYKSFKDLDFKNRLPFRYLVMAVGLIVLVAIRHEVHLFVLFLTYAVLGAVFGIFNLGRKTIRPSVYSPSQVKDDPDLIEEED